MKLKKCFKEKFWDLYSKQQLENIKKGDNMIQYPRNEEIYEFLDANNIENIIELLPPYIWDREYWLWIYKTNNKREPYIVKYEWRLYWDTKVAEIWDTLMEALKKTYKYLLDNNEIKTKEF